MNIFQGMISVYINLLFVWDVKKVCVLTEVSVIRNFLLKFFIRSD